MGGWGVGGGGVGGVFFFFNDTATTEIYTLSLHDALPICHRGSYAFDDEGAPATTTQLIKDGELVGRLHSRETAGQLEEAPTGNARCLSYQ